MRSLFCRVFVYDTLGYFVWDGKSPVSFRYGLCVFGLFFVFCRFPCNFDLYVFILLCGGSLVHWYLGATLNYLFSCLSIKNLKFCLSVLKSPSWIWLAYPTIWGAEFSGYLFRPFVLLLRPTVNYIIGEIVLRHLCVGGGFLSNLCINLVLWVFFIYDVVLMAAHAYIISEIIHYTSG
uniref:ATP synthase F0 subunit 6 n=1 Tax=Tanaisia sp. SS-2020 TaxID=2780549 RepID=A0A894JSA8_9TREM|nr:ATP synthase F0 subunit 6 [Tanaisia sp. SS-2020]